MKSKTTVASAAVLIASLAGCATTRGPRRVDDVVRGGARPESDWSRVAQVVPGAELAVTRTRSQPATRYFVSANAATVTVLNLTNPALPPVAIRVLREMAARRPENSAAMRGTASFATGGYLGSHWSSHETEGVIYQPAPQTA